MPVKFDRNAGMPAPTQVIIGCRYVDCVDSHPVGCHVYTVAPQLFEGDGILYADSIAYCWQKTDATICPLVVQPSHHAGVG